MMTAELQGVCEKGANSSSDSDGVGDRGEPSVAPYPVSQETGAEGGGGHRQEDAVPEGAAVARRLRGEISLSRPFRSSDAILQ